MGVEEWLGGERREVKPLLMKIGAAASLSLAGYLFYRLGSLDDRHGRASPPGAEGARESRGNPKDRVLLQRLLFNGGMSSDGLEISRSRRNSREDGGYLFEQFHELMLENPLQKISVEDEEKKREIAYLKGLVQSLQERERSLEDQLLEYYGIKEQESIVEELQNRMNISAMEAELLSVRVDFLQAEKQRLEEQLSDYSATKAELESAKGKIDNLKKKLETDSAMAKESIADLYEKVSALRDLESRGEEEYREMEKRMTRLNDLEREVAELREMNSKLAQEKGDLSEKLRSSQITRPSSAEFSQAPEESDETRHLRQRNDEMGKEIEQLQADRCADVEELVYLKWINACLRYELRNYHTPPGKTTARDLSKTLSPKSEQKVKQLIKEYANPGSKDRSPNNVVDFDWDSCSSSQASSQTENGEPDEASTDASAATKASKTGKTKFLAKLKSLVLRKDTSGSPKSSPKSARRSTISASWLEETTGADSAASSSSCDNYDHRQDRDPSWTRNLSRTSQDFQRLKNNDDLAESAADASRCKSDLGESRGMRSAMSEEAFIRSPLRLRNEEEAMEAREKLSHGRLETAPEIPSPRKKTVKARLRSMSFSSSCYSFL